MPDTTPQLLRLLSVAHYDDGSATVRDTRYNAETAERISDATYTTITANAYPSPGLPFAFLREHTPELVAVDPDTRAAIVITVSTTDQLDARTYSSFPGSTRADLLHRHRARHDDDARDLLARWLEMAHATRTPR